MLESVTLDKKNPPVQDGSRNFSWARGVGVAIVFLCVFAAVVCISSLSRSKPVLGGKRGNKISPYSVYANALGTPAMMNIFMGNEAADLGGSEQRDMNDDFGAADLGDSEPRDMKGGFELQSTDGGAAAAGASSSASSSPSDGECDDIDTSTVVKLTPSQPEGDTAQFGVYVVQLEDTLVVGANLDNEREGVVYVYHRDEEGTWNEVQKLKPTDPLANHMFGVRLLIPEEYPNVLFVFSLAGRASKGVTIFQRNSATDLYSYVAQLTVSEESCGLCSFGFAMASEGTTLMIGANVYLNRGAVFVFEATSEDGTGWEQVQKLMAEDDLGVDAYDGFGYDIVLRDGFLAVAALGSASHIADYAGAVYLFEKIDSVWTQFAILYPNEDPETSYYAIFGFLTLSEDGKTLTVGALGDNFKGNDAGTVYIFSNTEGEKEWRLTQQLYGADTEEGDWFGFTVRFYEELLIVGAPYADGNTEESGAVYVFCEADGEWEEVSKLSAAVGAPGDNFGVTLSVEEHDLIIGAHRNDGNGAIYIYELEE